MLLFAYFIFMYTFIDVSFLGLCFLALISPFNILQRKMENSNLKIIKIIYLSIIMLPFQIVASWRLAHWAIWFRHDSSIWFLYDYLTAFFAMFLVITIAHKLTEIPSNKKVLVGEGVYALFGLIAYIYFRTIPEYRIPYFNFFLP